MNLIRQAAAEAAALTRAAYERTAGTGGLPRAQDLSFGAAPADPARGVGDFVCTFALTAAPRLRLPADEIARTAAAAVDARGSLFSRADAAGGYINFTLGPRFFERALALAGSCGPAQLRCGEPAGRTYAVVSPPGDPRTDALTASLYAMLTLSGGAVRYADGAELPTRAVSVRCGDAAPALIRVGAVRPEPLPDGLPPDAVRFSLLSRRADLPLTLDPAPLCRRDFENPLYLIRYTCERADRLARPPAAKADGAGDLTPEERALLLTLAYFPERLRCAALAYDPSGIHWYLRALCRDFRRFYLAKLPPTAARQTLAAGTRDTLRLGLSCLGIPSIPGPSTFRRLS